MFRHVSVMCKDKVESRTFLFGSLQLTCDAERAFPPETQKVHNIHNTANAGGRSMGVALITFSSLILAVGSD